VSTVFLVIIAAKRGIYNKFSIFLGGVLT